MTVQSRTLVVEQLPERLDIIEGRAFLRQIESCMSHDRPRVVLDCSHLRQVDRSVIHILLCCLEEAIKRNGDVKLAALAPEAKKILQLAGVDRIFEIHQTTNDAVKSFCQPSATWVHKNHFNAA